MTTSAHTPGLQRKLQSRHLSMIAIGGSIGTGLFLASGATIANAGPGGALLAYCLIGVMIYFLMTSLGELATHNPTSGAFFTYGTKYVEGGFGFALGLQRGFDRLGGRVLCLVLGQRQVKRSAHVVSALAVELQRRREFRHNGALDFVGRRIGLEFSTGILGLRFERHALGHGSVGGRVEEADGVAPGALGG